MQEIRDCKGRIACKGNANTGLVEVVYKRCKTSTKISIGGTFKIEREGVVTVVTRINDSAFYVESYDCVA